MNQRRASLLLAAAISVPAGCAHEQPGPVPDAAPLRATPQDATEFIRFERRTLEFRPSRDDFTVASAVFSLFCSKPGEVRIDGARPDSSWRYVDLTRVDENRFELPPLEIEIPREHTGLVCMSVKVWFHQVPNEYDSLFYLNTPARL